jgi:hypothetical protein
MFTLPQMQAKDRFYPIENNNPAGEGFKKLTVEASNG